VLELAFRQASLHGLALVVIPCFRSVTRPTRPGDDGPVPDDAEEQRVLLAEAVTALREKFPDVEVRLQLTRGLVDECLSGSPPVAHLVIVGRRAGPGWARFLHASGAMAVLERSGSTVALVPEGDVLDLSSKPTLHHAERNTP
jgi:nucleotide-binding universal stress UspA family protein